VADEVQVLTVAVHKDFRRRGVARALLNQALGVGCGGFALRGVLEVRKSNTAAQLLYKSLGFRVVGERPNYYDLPKESAVLMELELKDGKTA
jgi:ribosomal-protein-alanine N-acetyltransferase